MTWKTKTIIKNPDDTFIVKHSSTLGEHPYHVCSKEVDPANLYDLAEVAALWDSLPEGHPNKQIFVEPEPDPDTRTAEEKRQDAYVVEADPLFRQYQYYLAEAEAWELQDDEENADAARGKAQEYLTAYLQAKQAIRERYPDNE